MTTEAQWKDVVRRLMVELAEARKEADQAKKELWLAQSRNQGDEKQIGMEAERQAGVTKAHVAQLEALVQAQQKVIGELTLVNEKALELEALEKKIEEAMDRLDELRAEKEVVEKEVKRLKRLEGSLAESVAESVMKIAERPWEDIKAPWKDIKALR